jgi:hypothetical protein
VTVTAPRHYLSRTAGLEFNNKDPRREPRDNNTVQNGEVLLVSGTSVYSDSGSCDSERFCVFIGTGTARHTANCA